MPTSPSLRERDGLDGLDVKAEREEVEVGERLDGYRSWH
jgi:hypothetical protein